MSRFGLGLLGAAGLAAAGAVLLLATWRQRLRSEAVPSSGSAVRAADPGTRTRAGPGRRALLPQMAGEAETGALIDQWLARIESGRSGNEAERAELEGLEAALLARGERAAQALALRLDQRAPSGEARDRLFNVLRRLPGAVAEGRLAEEARGGPQRSTRSLAMDALAERRTASAVDTLAVIARTDPELPARPLIAGPRQPEDTGTELPDEEVFTPRMKAMMALAETQDPRAAAVLIDILRTSPDESLRMQAARFLQGFRSDPGTAEALHAAALSDPSAYVRLAALHALDGSSDPTLAALLARIIAGDRDAGVRALAQQLQANLEP